MAIQKVLWYVTKSTIWSWEKQTPKIKDRISRICTGRRVTFCISSTDLKPSIPQSLKAACSSGSERVSRPSFWIVLSSCLILSSQPNIKSLSFHVDNISSIKSGHFLPSFRQCKPKHLTNIAGRPSVHRAPWFEVQRLLG